MPDDMSPRYNREYALIQATGASPITKDDIRRAYNGLGLAAGDRIMMHSSMSSIGWIVGSYQSVIQATMEQLGDGGLLAMPCHSNELSDPEGWANPPVPESWFESIRRSMPPFDLQRSNCRRLGTVAEGFRCWPGVLRSGHPHYSVSAWGEGAREFTEDHSIDSAFGETSPYAKLCKQEGKVLLFGVDYDNCSVLHVSEHRARWPGKVLETLKAPVGSDASGRTIWAEYEMVPEDSDLFPNIGAEFAACHGEHVHTMELGMGTLTLVSAAPLIDFAIDWLGRHRDDS